MFHMVIEKWIKMDEKDFLDYIKKINPIRTLTN